MARANVGAVSYQRLENGCLDVLCNSWVSGHSSMVRIDSKDSENFVRWWEGQLSLDLAIPHLNEVDEELILTGIRPGEE